MSQICSLLFLLQALHPPIAVVPRYFLWRKNI